MTGVLMLLGRTKFFGEPAQQIAKNKLTGQKPDWMTWEQWGGHHRPRYFNECHWYDPENITPTGHCWGGLSHNHQSRIMKWYWASPFGIIIPVVWELWQFSPFFLSALLERLGYYRLLERFGVDTSPR